MKKLFFAVFLLLFITVSVQAQTPYYQGKTIRIVTGYPAGDVNDTWPRLIGQHMTKYIPGNPNFHRPEHDRCRLHDRGKPCVRRRQARRTYSRMDTSRRSTSINSSDAKKFSSTGPNTVSSARRCRASITSTCAPTVPYKTIEDVRKAVRAAQMRLRRRHRHRFLLSETS